MPEKPVLSNLKRCPICGSADLISSGNFDFPNECMPCKTQFTDEQAKDAQKQMPNALYIGLSDLAGKWDSAEYAIEQVNNPLLPQEQCAIELRSLIQEFSGRRQ